ncbi:MAG: Acetyltransferases and hydrolases with the alpha/beta hydrolase fold protein [Parcubacteria group bacterium Gr01-1014_29]|nr:MAG: Acetyltransferases and hydrolases with the alpha/beta hydrolase fold protein [Parcubacteria group bacterium Gr01-1014_29]
MRGIVCSCVFFAAPVSVLAFTDVSGDISSDTTWIRAESPYIIRSNTSVGSGVTLTIKPGVVVKFANPFSSILSVKGSLVADADGGEPIIFTSFADDEAGGDTNGDGGISSPTPGNWRGIIFQSPSAGNMLRNTVMRYGGGGDLICMVCVGSIDVDLTVSESVVAASASLGVHAQDGILSISKSIIENNRAGVEISNSNIGRTQPQGVVDNTIIRNNFSFGLKHGTFVEAPPVDARNNWWGDVSGPYHSVLNPSGLGNAVIGTVLIDPWLTEEPDVELPPAECCSNVAFIPGLQATRLELDGNRLWEPNSPADTPKLFFDVFGEPTVPNIATDGVIDEAFGFNIYKSFIDFMNVDLVNAGIIHEWMVFPYDWRFSVEDAARKGILQTNNQTYWMATELEQLAASSKTGKVTIIAHSNGGLVAKELISLLEEEGKAALVDKLILVATPQLGTPKALAGALHGDEQTIPSKIGVLLTKEVARELAENMPSAYGLLPSMQYFSDVFDPVIEFDPDVAEIYDFPALYGDAIDSRIELDSFLLGDNGVRVEPSSLNTDEPNVLGENLLRDATSTQGKLDTWTPPAGIKVTQIAGWGLDTIRGIRYDDCDILLCPDELNNLDRELLLVHDGDGTVVIPSAVAIDTETYYVNLPENNFLLKRNRDHADILEVKSINDLLRELIKGEEFTESAFITDTRPIPKKEDKKLRFRIHSPVSLDLYDADGNHTGLISNPDPNLGGLHGIEQEIPNSYYLEFGETKYAGADTFATTTVVLVGQANGTFTFEIDEVLGDKLVATTSFSDIPVIEGTRVTTNVTHIASSTVLSIDMDGDGETDAVIEPGEGVSIDELLGILRGVVKSFDLDKKAEKRILKQIDNLEKVLDKEFKNKKKKKMETDKAFLKLEQLIEKFEKNRLLSIKDAQELLHIIEQIKEGVVE